MESLDWFTLDQRSFRLCKNPRCATPPLLPLAAAAPSCSAPPAVALSFLEQREPFADDFLHCNNNSAPPPSACILSVVLTRNVLDQQLIIADAASWSVPSLGVEQAAFSHRGFFGTVECLFRKVINDIEMMRDGYPQQQQQLMDSFIDRVRAILFGNNEQAGSLCSSSCVLIVDDCSGLSCARAEPCSWVMRRSRARLFMEEEDLRLVSLSYTLPTVHQRIDVARDATPAVLDAAVLHVAQMIRAAGRVVAFTGAGISVESGIRPFRAAEGASSIWGDFDASKATLRAQCARFNKYEQQRKAWWAMKHSLYPEMMCAEPNAAHLLFTKLHKQGKLGGVLTQNIDWLHQRAGVPTEDVLELHGTMCGLICRYALGPQSMPLERSGSTDHASRALWVHRSRRKRASALSSQIMLLERSQPTDPDVWPCSDHKTKFNPIPLGAGECSFRMEDAECRQHNYFEGVDVPMCPECGCALRSETVMFEQPMPEGYVDKARETVASADLLIVIGSTLIVAPANQLPAIALRKGIPIVMINFDETQYDQYVHAMVRQPAGEFLGRVMHQLGS